MLSAQTIQNQHSNIFTYVHGNVEIAASHCDVPEDATPRSLVHVIDAAQLAEARRHNPAILIVPAKIAACLGSPADSEGCCFSVTNISMAMAILLKYFDTKCY